MSKKTELKPLAAAVGAALAASAFTIPAANAESNPFEITTLSSGYMVAESHEGKCGEGKCGEGKDAEGSCGEGKCGEGKCGMKKMDADGDGSVTKAEFMTGAEQKFAGMDADGDGKLTGSEMEGKCGEGKCGEGKDAEGKCGEGKCGG